MENGKQFIGVYTDDPKFARQLCKMIIDHPSSDLIESEKFVWVKELRRMLEFEIDLCAPGLRMNNWKKYSYIVRCVNRRLMSEAEKLVRDCVAAEMKEWERL